MELQFKAEEWQRLPLDERMRRCRLLSEEARKLAADADPRFKLLYLEIAAQWSALANEIADHIRSAKAP